MRSSNFYFTPILAIENIVRNRAQKYFILLIKGLGWFICVKMAVESLESCLTLQSCELVQSGLFQDKNLEYEKLQLKVQHDFQIVSAV